MSGFASSPLSANHANQILKEVLKGLRVVLTSSTRVEPGELITASLVPGTLDINATEFVNGAVNVTMLSKDVVYASSRAIDIPSQGDLHGDALSLAAGLPGTVTPPTVPVPGILGQVFGSLTVPQLRVRLDVKWIVRGPSGEEREGKEFLAPQGLTSPNVSLLFAPLTLASMNLDLLKDPLGKAAVRCLWARVTLSIGDHTLPGPTERPIEIGGIPLLILPLPVPTVVAVFSEPNFGVNTNGDTLSAVLILVPRNSPFTSAEPLFKTLRKIESIVSALKSIGGAASWLLGLDALTDSVPDQPRIRFVKGYQFTTHTTLNGIHKLDSVVIKTRRFFGFKIGEETFDDKAESILVFGLPGTKVQFFNDVNFKTMTTDPSTDQGTYTLVVGNECFVAIPTLETDCLKAPVTFPPDRTDLSALELDTSGKEGQVWARSLSGIRFVGLPSAASLLKIAPPQREPPQDCQQPPETILGPKTSSRG